MRLTCWGLIRSPDFLVCDTFKFLVGWISGIRITIFCCLLCSPALALLCQKDKRSRGGGDDPAFVPRKTFLNISLAFLSKSCKTRTDSPKRFFRCLDLELVIAAPQKVWTRCIAAYQESSAKWRWWYFLQNICNCQPEMVKFPSKYLQLSTFYLHCNFLSQIVGTVWQYPASEQIDPGFSLKVLLERHCPEVWLVRGASVYRWGQ